MHVKTEPKKKLSVKKKEGIYNMIENDVWEHTNGNTKQPKKKIRIYL